MRPSPRRGVRAHTDRREPLVHGEPAEAPHAGERRRDEHAVVALVAQRPRDEPERRAHAQRDVAERRLAARHARHAASQLERATRRRVGAPARPTPPARCVAGSASCSETSSGRPHRDVDAIAKLGRRRRRRPSARAAARRRGRARRAAARRRPRPATASAATRERRDPAEPGSPERSQSGASSAAATARRRVGTTATARMRRRDAAQRSGTQLTRSLRHAHAREQRAQHVVRRCAPPPRARARG